MDKQKEIAVKNTEWIIPGNPDRFDIVDAFRKLGALDWVQNTNVAVGDIVYIYISNSVRAIQLKCKVNAVNKTEPTIDDSQFNKSEEFDGSEERYMELEMLEEFSTDLFAKKALEHYGFMPPRRAVRVPAEVKNYLDIVQKLLHAEEMNPDSHDATYELMREVINAYRNMGDLSLCDYKDLNLVYLMCVGTWKQGLDAKKKTVADSHLPDREKNRLKDLLDIFWVRAQNREYKNCETKDTNFGMFGTGFYSFQNKADERSSREFIQMCIDIMDMSDDDEIFSRCEKTLNENFHGMRAASASMVLHCLKPMTFPIFNSNMGAENIYVYFNIGIKHKTELYAYIKNVRRVKAFRDQYFKVKNYRIFDIAAWNLSKATQYIDDEAIQERGMLQEMKRNNKKFDKNLILYGPPGTGKTYNSVIYAVAICDGKSVDELTDYDAVMARYDELKKAGRIAFTTFHQSYGYEEFIEGIKPIIDENKQDIGYTIEPGVFKEFCENAKSAVCTKNDDFIDAEPHVFIIDEINRGNISKIFGELITLIENTKRSGMPEAASAILPYSGDEFSVPANVYILGTMNTADRSIALMDTALRRRFQFIENMPDSDVLRKIHADKVEDLDVAAMLDKINERITFLYDREHTIGHAFFTGLKDDASIETLQSIFEKSVIPLLQEYFYEDYQKIQLVLGDNAKSDDSLKFVLDKKVIAKNIFKGNVEDVIDLPEKQYLINRKAFENINSYKEIL